METLGNVVSLVFEDSKWIGQEVYVSDEHLTLSEICDHYSQHLITEIIPNYVTPETYASFNFPGSDDLANMFKYKDVFNHEFCKKRDPEKLKQQFPELKVKGFDYFLCKHYECII
jgi:hypothetical protein